MSRTKARKIHLNFREGDPQLCWWEEVNVSAKPAKPCQEKPFVQVEGELTQAQLEAIAAGGLPLN